MPGKEPGFFREYRSNLILNANHPEKRHSAAETAPLRSFKAYMKPAMIAAKDQWILDGSTDYLSDNSAAQRIAEFSENRTVKLICILRDPVERALSEYRHTVRDGLEMLSFQDAVAEEENRRRANFQPLFFHVRRSQYYDDIKRFQALFPNNLLMLSIAEFSDMNCCARKVLDFIGLRPVDLGNIRQYNSTVSSPSRVGERSHLRKMIRGFKMVTGFKKRPKLKYRTNEEDRKLLKQLLQADIQKCAMDPSIPTDDWTCTDTIKAVTNGPSSMSNTSTRKLH